MFGNLTRAVGAVALARLATAMAALVTQILLAWALTRETNGLIQKTFIVVQVAVLAGAFGIQTSLYNFLPRLDTAARRRLIAQSAGLLLLIGTVVGAIIFVYADAISGLLRQPQIAPLLRMGALIVITGLPAMVTDPVFIVEDRPWFSSATALGAMLIQSVLVGAVLVMQAPLEWVFGAIAAANVVKAIPALAFVWLRMPGERWWVVDRTLLVQQLTYIVPVGVTALIDTISSWLDRTIIALHYDSANLATYTYGAIEIPFMSIVIGALTPVLLPQFSRLLSENNAPAVLQLWHRATEKAALILFGLFFFFAWLAPEFVVSLYSEKYRASAIYFRIYLLLLPFRIIAFMPMLFALGRRKYAMIGACCEVLINAVVTLALVRETPLGMMGAALGTVISTIWQVWFYLGGISATLGVEYRHLLPWRELGRLFLKAALFFLPLGLLKIPWMRAVPDQAVFIAGCCIYALYVWYSVLPRLKSPGRKAGA